MQKVILLHWDTAAFSLLLSKQSKCADSEAQKPTGLLLLDSEMRIETNSLHTRSIIDDAMI